MPGNSPGPEGAKMWTNIALRRTQVDVAVREMVEQSAEALNSDDEGRVIKAKRLKYQSTSPTGQNRVSSDLNVTSIGGQRRSRQDPRTREGLATRGASLNVEAHEHSKEPGKSDATKGWAFANRNSSSFPDFGSDDPKAVEISSPGRSIAMNSYIKGSFRPRNTLSNNNSNSSTTTRIANKTKSTDPREAFNLFGDNYERSSTRVVKRPRDNSTTVDTSASSNIIDLDKSEVDSTQESQMSLERAAKNSVQSSSISSMRKAKPAMVGLNISEFSKVEAQMSDNGSKRRRVRRSSQNTKVDPSYARPNIHPGPYQHPGRRKREDHSISEAELKDDPIDESETSSKVDTSYQGTAHLAPPRKKRISQSSDFVSESSPPHRSNHFPAVTRKSVATPSQTIHPLPRSRSLALKAASFSTILDEEDSLDQLSLDHTPPASPEKMGAKGAELPVSLSSEGDIRRTQWNGAGKEVRSSITKSTATPSKKGNSKRQELLCVSRILTETKTYMFNSERKQTAFHYDEATKTFELVDMDDANTFAQHTHLNIKLEKVTKIEANSGSAKTVVWRNNDTSVRNFSPRICIEFVDTATASHFIQKLFHNGSSIKLLEKDVEQLDKIFIRLAVAHVSDPVVPEDLELMRANRERKFDGEASSKQRLLAANESQQRRQSDLSIEQDGAWKKSLVRNMEGRSAAEDGTESRLDSEGRVVEAPHRRTSKRYRKQSTMIGDDIHNVPQITERADRCSRRSARSPTPQPERWSLHNPQYKTTWSKSLSWPDDSKKKVTVDVGDIERLDEGEFLNDNIIAFYLRYLEHELELKNPEIFERIYFQNTFFYKTLSSGQGRNSINYEAVKRWTKGDIFKYDYIIVPVNENFHWYLAIICHPGKLLIPEDSMPTNPENGDPLNISVAGRDSSITASATRAGNESTDSKATAIDLDQQELTPYGVSQHRSSSPEIRNKVEQMSLEDPMSPADADHQAPTATTACSSKGQTIDVIRNSTPHNERSTPGGNVEIMKDGSEVSRSPKGKKVKRKPPQRLLNPSKPRIITLDSLHNPHSPTCKRLRDWLVSEAKEKRNIEISDYTALGTTATAIPLQPNFCDCGIFLLGYVEKFLKDPDTFISDILQKRMSVERDWRDMDASKMRCDIRALIFQLHGEHQRKLKEEKLRRKDPKVVEPPVDTPVTVIPDEAEEAVIHSVSSEASDFSDSSFGRKHSSAESNVAAKPILEETPDKRIQGNRSQTTRRSQQDIVVTEASLARGIGHASPLKSPATLRSSHALKVRSEDEKGSPHKARNGNVMKKFAKHPPDNAMGSDESSDEFEVLREMLASSPGSSSTIKEPQPGTPTGRTIGHSRITRSSPHRPCDSEGIEVSSLKERMIGGTWDRKRKRADEGAHVID